MAVTLISAPEDFSPVYNAIEWVFSSPNYTRCDFNYICDVYVNGSFAIRLRAEPEGVNGYGYIRLDRVLQDFISKDFKHDLVGFASNDNSSCEYYIEVREQYNSNYATTCIGPKTLSSVLYSSLGSPNNIFGWNGALQYKEYLDFKGGDPYFLVDSYDTKFLNNVPNFLRVPYHKCSIPTFNYTIDGAVYNAGFADFLLDGGSGGVILPNGTTFSYTVDDGTTLGISNPGTGTITGYNAITFRHQTNVVAANNVGVVISGTLTLTPIEKVKSNGWMVFSFLQDYTNNVADSLEVKTYDTSNVLIDTYSISNAINNKTHLSVGVGPNNLNDWGATQSPAIEIIDETVKYYSVQLLDSGNVAVSELKYLKIDARETRFKKYRLHWSTKRGGYDSYTFDLLSAYNIDSGQETFTKILNSDYTEGDRGETTINVDARERYKFQTNQLQRIDAVWTKELYNSSDIYVVDNTPKEVDYPVTNFVYDSANDTIDLVMPFLPPIGTEFKYVLTLTGVNDQQYMGSGVIVAHSGGNAKTNVSIPGSAGLGVSISGNIYAEVPQLTIIPMIPVTQNWDDKERTMSRNIIYSIELQPSYKVNTQSY